jgi:hypothetical protein
MCTSLNRERHGVVAIHDIGGDSFERVMSIFNITC